MKVDYFVAWYKKHARNILEGNEDAGESYDILKKCEEQGLQLKGTKIVKA